MTRQSLPRIAISYLTFFIEVDESLENRTHLFLCPAWLIVISVALNKVRSKLCNYMIKDKGVADTVFFNNIFKVDGT